MEPYNYEYGVFMDAMSLEDIEYAQNYMKYRGKCKEFSEKLCEENPELTLVRGYYYCPCEGKCAHWWCVDKNGVIHDPTKLQFRSKGYGHYEEFDGIFHCEECGKPVKEEDAIPMGNGHYVVCSNACAMRLVGL